MSAQSDSPFAADLSDEAAAEGLRKISIPPCPAIVLALLEESRRDEVDFVKISRMIAGDVALAAAVLKTANSPFFALRRKVQSIQQAVAVLGLRNLLKIVYGFALRHSLGGGAAGLERFWERSNYNAVVTSYLAARWPQVSADDAYTFGLFHEAGVAVLTLQHADYGEVFARACRTGGKVVAAETARYHTSHPVVGALLARNWYLPETVVWAIRYHHDYSVLAGTRAHAPRPVQTLVALGLVSEHLVGCFLQEADDPEWHVGGAAALAFLGLEAEQSHQLLETMRQDLQEIRAYRA
ncbi:MAG: HDOD domain-containing protein [Pseudomonadota bacterium]